MNFECRYEYMFPRELQKAVEKCPVFFMPTGLLEWHADHLPLGQDALKAYGICLRAAEKLGGGIVLPANYFGCPGFSTYLGTLTYSEECLRPLFLAYMGQLKKAGAKVIVIITGHYGDCQVDFIKETAQAFAEANPDISVIARPEYEGIQVDGEVPADHAGKWETSMFWHFYPEHVDMEAYRTVIDDMKVYKDAPLDYFQESAHWDFEEDLRKTSSPELGKKAVGIITDKLVEDIKACLANLKAL